MHKNWIVFFLSVFTLFLQAQKIDLQKLETEIYKNNRQEHHTVSQKKLLNLLQTEGLSTEEEIKLNLLMSSTFRSIGDYGFAIKYLKKAKILAQDFQNNNTLKMKIEAELAFAYFDSNNYVEAEQVGQLLRENKFAGLDGSDRAYLIMQQGYIHFLNKKYELAQKDYEQSLSLLQQYSPCNQPVVLVKIMQLYSKLNDLDKVEKIYQQSMDLANSCKIQKYKVYATEEIKTIYQNRKLKDKAFLYQNKLDSLNILYQRDQKISVLHVENEDYLAQQNKNTSDTGFNRLALALAALLVLSGTGIYFYVKSSTYRKQKIAIEEENLQIKEILQQYSAQEFRNESKENHILNSELLNERQKELLQLMAEGLSNHEIAEKLFISENTVKYHVRNIYQILELKDRKDLFRQLRN